MEDVLIYHIAPRLSDRDIYVLASTSKRIQRMLSQLCRQRLLSIYRPYQSISVVNPYITGINSISIGDYNRYWNTNYRDYSHLYVVHYMCLLCNVIPVDYIVRYGYYDIVSVRVYQLWDSRLAADILVMDDPTLTRYVDIAIVGLYYYVLSINNPDTDYWYRVFIELLVDINLRYPVLHRIPSMKSILEDREIQRYFGIALFDDVISLSNLSRYLHYISYFGDINRWMLLNNIRYTISKNDNIESPNVVREFVRRLLDVVSYDYYNLYDIFKNVKNIQLADIAIEVIMDRYNNDIDVIKTLLLTRNSVILSVLVRRYGDSVISMIIDMVDTDDISYIRMLTDILLNEGRSVYIHMLLDRLYELDADDDIMSYVISAILHI